MEHTIYIEDVKITIKTADITAEHVDVVVNAANSQLLGGGGVDGAIHRAAGPSLLAACRALRAETLPQGLPPGQAVATTAGELHAGHIIHTVGPVWKGGNNKEALILADSYRNSLSLAVEYGLASIAFPAISTGVYGFPKERAAKIAWNTVNNYILNNETAPLRHIVFVFFSTDDTAIFIQTNKI